jgi:hypothetical protein
MNLDKEKQGLTIKIQEPAMLPLQPSGLRFLHFVIGGPVLGIVLPLGLLYARLRVDSRVRLGAVISDKHKLPLLAVVPHFWAPSETKAIRREVEWLWLVVGSTILIIAATIVMRLAQVV